MLMQQFPFLDPIHATPDLVARLRALADDAARLQQTRSISPARLQTAPLLKYWVPLRRSEGLRLIGQVSGHPLDVTDKESFAAFLDKARADGGGHLRWPAG